MREALKNELERQCSIGAGEFSVCPETGLWQVSADLDIDSLLRALSAHSALSTVNVDEANDNNLTLENIEGRIDELQRQAAAKRGFQTVGEWVNARIADLSATPAPVNVDALREALERAVAALGYINATCLDRETPLRRPGNAARSALGDILQKLGPELYDQISLAALSTKAPLSMEGLEG